MGDCKEKVEAIMMLGLLGVLTDDDESAQEYYKIAKSLATKLHIQGPLGECLINLEKLSEFTFFTDLKF